MMEKEVTPQFMSVMFQALQQRAQIDKELGLHMEWAYQVALNAENQAKIAELEGQMAIPMPDDESDGPEDPSAPEVESLKSV